MEKRWYEKQLRMIQTVLREPDIVDYDAEAVAAYLESVHANTFIINGGGIIDFFRHDLATANPNPFMKPEQDILKDITEACHKRDIKVIVRMDFRGVDKKIYDLQPDWFAVDEHGQPMFWADLPHIPNPLYAPCYLSYYRNEHAFELSEILLKRYNIDGIWENAPFQNRVCYCERCSTRYREEVGKELPRGGDFADASYDEYRAWKADNLNEHLANYRKVIKKYGEDKIYCAEIFGLFYESYTKNSSDLYQVKDHFDFLVTPLFTANHEPLHAPTTLVKFLKGLEPDKTPVMLFGHLGTNNELRYVASSVPESRIWLWEAVSSGGSIWDVTFNGQHPGATYDRRNALLCQDIYAYMKQYEDVLSAQQAEADVTILYSRASNNTFNKADRQKDAYITHIIGLEQLLLAEKLQYNFLLDQDLSEDTLAKVNVLVIPNGACLSDDELRLIRHYVHQGGKVISTYETSLYDENGRQRHDFGLADVFGCSFSGIRKDATQYGYQYVRHAEGHPMTKGFEETELIANWGTNLLVQPKESAECPLTFVPQIYPQSPERAWPRSFETKFPTCVVHAYGQGQSIYFPFGIDKHIWMHGHQDFRTLLANAFRLALGGVQKLTANAPQSVHFQLNRIVNSNDYIVHAINTTSAPFRPVLEIIPLHNIEVELTLPAAAEPIVQPMHADGAIQVKEAVALEEGGYRLRVAIDTLKEYASFRVQV